MACCPEGALGQLGTEGYKCKGKVEKVADLELYFVGAGSKCLIWNYDIFGFDSGRTRQTADLFAEAGYLVIIPDFYRGTYREPTAPDVVQWLKEVTNWTKLKQTFEDIVMPFARSKGAKEFGAIGTCWGSYMVLRECAYPEFKVGVSWHPSHSPISAGLGEEERALLAQVSCPQLFMPAQGDHANTRPGGLGQELLGNKLTITEFNDMQHGWTVRGDMSDPAVARDVKKAIKETLDFLKVNL